MCHFGMSLPISLKPVGGITSHLGDKLILGSSIVSVCQCVTIYESGDENKLIMCSCSWCYVCKFVACIMLCINKIRMI